MIVRTLEEAARFEVAGLVHQLVHSATWPSPPALFKVR
jgi:hypothetical protein